jgi:hypothetical protein
MDYDDLKYGAAIRVKFLGATNHRPARYKATFAHPNDKHRGQMTESYEYGERNGKQPFDMACRLVKETVEAFWKENGKSRTVQIREVMSGEVFADSYLFIVDYDIREG